MCNNSNLNSFLHIVCSSVLWRFGMRLLRDRDLGPAGCCAVFVSAKRSTRKSGNFVTRRALSVSSLSFVQVAVFACLPPAVLAYPPWLPSSTSRAATPAPLASSGQELQVRAHRPPISAPTHARDSSTCTCRRRRAAGLPPRGYDCEAVDE